jgi:hypothetical protein
VKSEDLVYLTIYMAWYFALVIFGHANKRSKVASFLRLELLVPAGSPLFSLPSFLLQPRRWTLQYCIWIGSATHVLPVC